MKVLSLFTVTLFLLPTTLPAQTDHTGFADLVERVQPAVVSIQATQTAQPTRNAPRDFFHFFNPRQMPERDVQNGGTGFLISSDGYLVTNRHVVADAKKVEVLIGENSHEAEVIGIDNSMDIALVKIEGSGFPHLTLGDSDQMRIGDVVLAMGYPLGLGFSVTSGIVSGLGRNMALQDMDIAKYIQTDADITFGSSGGPLLNTKGEVIAINTMIVSRGETFGFSIPSNLFSKTVDQLREFGVVKRGALGVTIGDLSEEDKEYFGIDAGARVGTVTAGMPAERAGIRELDIIVEIDGKKVNGADDVIGTVSDMLPGEKVTLKIVSDGRTETKTVELADRAAFFEDEPTAMVSRDSNESEEVLGFTVLPIDNRLRGRLGLDKSIEGVLVDSVDPSSEAAREGLTEGSLITHINGAAVESTRDVSKAIEDVPSGKLINIRARLLQRNNFEVSLTPPRRIYIRKP